MPNILILDDDKELTSLLSEFLGEHKFKTTVFHAPSEVFKYLEHNKPALLLLDIMLPEMDGFQVLRKIRETLDLPVIMLTAKGEVSDKVVGLELGADDYLAKPFEPLELLARIQSLLRRVHRANSMLDILEFEGLVVDKVREEVLLDKEPINLSTSEFEALLLFANNSNEVLDREFLVENLRGITWQTYDRSVDVLVSRLRNKLGETPHHTRFLKTIHGVGYKFIAIPKNK